MRRYKLFKHNNPSIERAPYRFIALENFADVKAGDLGGYTDGTCIIDSRPGDTCWVYDNACLIEGSILSDHTQLRDNCIVSYGSRIYNNAVIKDNAYISDARVYMDATVKDNAGVSQNAMIFGNASIQGNARVSGGAKVYQNAVITDNASIHKASIYGDAVIGYNIAIVEGLFDSTPYSVDSPDGRLVLQGYGCHEVLLKNRLYSVYDIRGIKP